MAALMTAACAREPVEHGITVSDVQMRAMGNVVQVRIDQDVSLSRAARRALWHGVTLDILVSSELRHGDTRNIVTTDRRRWELRYLPLSERFQVSGPDADDVQTFPRMRHALRAMGRLQYALPTGELPPGDYALRVRVRLDRSSLPVPIQLPALLFSRWWHDSDWSEWPLKTNA